MFKAANPYDEIVVKATDENLTSENWQLNLDVCDKVTGEGANGARNCVAAILKRLVHRNANVQLYSLTLSDALSKNCGEIAHQELASRSYTQTLQRIVTDRNTHDTVKKKCLNLIKEWNNEWGHDESVGLIRETMESLKKQNFSFEEDQEPSPIEPSSEQLRKEDEELRRVLELSLQDQGGRVGYSSTTTAAAPGSSSSTAAAEAAATSSSSQQATSNGYTPSSSLNKNLPDPSRQGSGGASAPAAAPPAASSSSTTAQPAEPTQPAVSRVRALYEFTPTESGELAFRKGDVLRVLDSVYEHWWRGELNGEVGIFPVNFVELLPDPTPADVQREAEMEAKIFAQANDIDRLLSKLRGLDPARDNLAEDEELQELYQSSLSMRPKIVKLIDRYNMKVDELRTMNEKFVRARSTFDVMMEQSLARYNPSASRDDYTNARPDYRYGASSAQAMPPSGFQPTSPQHAQQGYQQQQQQQHHQHHHQQVPADGTHLQAPPPQQGQQQQQDYAQAWAAWYAQNGYQQPSSSPSQSMTGALPTSQPGQAVHPAAGPPPHVNDPGYAQWYYSQQQQQQPLTSTQAAPPLTSPPAGSYDYRQGLATDNSSSTSLHDQDKRALFERARAEAEAYHRAHQQHAATSNSGNTAEPPLQ